MVNYYGSLCTKMYELLHPQAPQDELEFYLSYANKDQKILEGLCGSGRFFLPFLQKGYNISGFDSSKEMLDELIKKAANARVYHNTVDTFDIEEKFDYIFITSGSVSLFTKDNDCFDLLCKMKDYLTVTGKFVFAVATTAAAEKDTFEFNESRSVKTDEGYRLALKLKNYYDKENKIQFSPSLYELYDGEKLLQTEEMDFQIRLYDFGELDQQICRAGFKNIIVYKDFKKTIAQDSSSGMLLYECW